MQHAIGEAQQHERPTGREGGGPAHGLQRGGHPAIESLLLVARPQHRVFEERRHLDAAIGVALRHQQLAAVDLDLRLRLLNRRAAGSLRHRVRRARE